MKAKDLIIKLKEAGWTFSYSRSSHHYFTHPDRPGHKITWPVYSGKDLKPATLAEIRKTTGLKF
ncbi:MAG: type II toxin-antitoxin system HicA family toxin [Deltaproteobacteria bacterium]|nr:type II toxin-antitoxin system HicA family toxin [Deltaproteobacteria bacterium]